MMKQNYKFVKLSMKLFVKCIAVASPVPLHHFH